MTCLWGHTGRSKLSAGTEREREGEGGRERGRETGRERESKR